jgi:biopolymer transport protein ExbB
MQMLNFIMLGFKSSAGWIMWCILFVGFASLGLLVERVWYLYFQADKGTGTFMKGLSKYLKAGDYDMATKYASSYKTPLAKGVLSILQNRVNGTKAIKKAVDEVFLTEAPKIKRYVHLFNIFANLATLVGLTGTIYGTMECFEAIANAPAAQRATQLAAGISITMSATLFGLIWAVMNIFAYGLLSTKADKIIEDMDEKTAKLINAVEE